MSELQGRILTPDGFLRGRLHFGERIEEIEPADVDGPLLLPGFVDVHVHGGGGADTMDGREGALQVARFHLKHGTTTIVPTTITNPWDKILAALNGVAQLVGPEAGEEVLPAIPGAHLEGPFISPGRLGAQPPFTLPPEPELVAQALGSGAVRVVTIAPELPGALEAARAFVAAGARVSIGHTLASYDEVLEFARVVRQEEGVLGFTHLFNAMGGVAGREPGPAGAALGLLDAHCELIFDGHHVARGSLHAARAAKGERLLFVTDCIRAGGSGDGETELGGQPVRVSGGAARLADGTLAGSVLTLDRALRNALAAGVPLAEASSLVSAAPARYLGLADRGELARGKRADIVALGDDHRVIGVWVAGRGAA